MEAVAEIRVKAFQQHLPVAISICKPFFLDALEINIKALVSVSRVSLVTTHNVGGLACRLTNYGMNP